MADGTFCEYTGQMDNALMSQMSGYGTRGTSENLGKYCLRSSCAFDLCPPNVAISFVTHRPLYNSL
jgi:hypothetical protein